MQAALRGLRGTCPRCGEVSLFRGWLKPVDTCPACGQDWTYQQADDFPPYVAIIVTGHLMAPLLIFLTLAFDLGPALVAAIIVPTALIMMLAILQPAKGAIIAAQWWHGLNGFRKERPVLAHDADTG
jgi:uncharacterized protein (DUF983 family)